MKLSFPKTVAIITSAATAFAVVGLTTFNERVVPPAQAATISTSGTYTTGPNAGEQWEVTNLENIPREEYTWNLGPTQPFETQELAQEAIAKQAVGGATASSTQYTVYILKGDAMTWTGGVSFPQSLASSIFGPYTPGIAGIWAPEYRLGYYGFNSVSDDYFYGVDELNPKNMENITINDSDPTHIPVCPDSTPNVGRTHATVLWDGWCWGILAFTATIDSAHENVTIPTVDMVVPGKTWTYATLPSLSANNVYDPAQGGATAWGGPNNPARGDNVEGYAVLSILDPQLEVKKQVCTSYDSQGNPTCTNESNNGWVDDDTFGDPDDPSMPGLPSGVKDGVESGQVPPGTTHLMWRVTARNAGNVPFTGIHVAADAITFDPAVSDDPIDSTNADTCSGMKFASTYDSNGNPRTDVLHDFARYAGDETFSEPGVLMPGSEISQVCTTVMDHAFTGTVQNTVGLNALFDDPDDPIFQQPEGFEWNDDGTLRLGGPLNNQPVYPDVHTALMYRFTGYNGEVGQVPSNTDSAQVTIPNPMIKLTKWVCQDYDDNKAATCMVPPNGSPELTLMAGTGTVNSDGTYTPVEGQPPSTDPTSDPRYTGWVKAAEVPYEADGIWLLVVTNIGNTPVTNIDFNTEYVTGKDGGSDQWQHVPVDDPDVLLPGNSATYTVRTRAIIDTGERGHYVPYGTDVSNYPMSYAERLTTGKDGPVTVHYWNYVPQAERPYITDPVNPDVVNVAQATATPVKENPNPQGPGDTDKYIPVTGLDGEPMGSIFSNPSTAEARTHVPSAALKLTKWVCSIGTGCSYDLTSAEISQLSGVTVVPGGEGELAVSTGQPVSGVTADAVNWQWLPETMVGYNTNADWLLVATNIGDASIANVTVRDQATAPGSVSSDMPMVVYSEETIDSQDPSTKILASGKSITYRATTFNIISGDENNPDTNPDGLYAGTPWFEPDRLTGAESTVNQAYALGTAWDVVAHQFLADSQTGRLPWPVQSNTSSAEVNTFTVAIGDWVWFDRNADGLQSDTPDTVQSGVEGVRVDLLYADGSPVLDSSNKPVTTTTDAAGFYFFDMLAPGTYRVAFYLPAGYAWTAPLMTTGGDDDPSYVYSARDSNAAFEYSPTSSATLPTDDSPVSDDPLDPVRVTKTIDMNVSSLLDFSNHENVAPVADAVIAQRFKSTIQADFINPTIDAGVIYPNPEIKITKWVCSIYDANNQPACDDPYDQPPGGKSVWDDLNGYTAEQHALYTGVPAGGWEKEATIPAGATAKWLIVVTNVGGTGLADVHLVDTLEGSPADPDNGRGATGIATIYDPDEGLTNLTSVSELGMTQTKVFMMTTENITNQNETVPDIQYGVDDVNNDPKNKEVGEPTYWDGTDDVVNSVYAVGDPVDQDGNPVLGPDGVTPLPPETSNTSTAEVNTIGYAIGDYVWIDADRNGIQDSDESALKGVSVTLYRSATDADGSQILVQAGTTVTDDNGYYLFDNLSSGTYQVRFTLPNGYLWTQTGQGGYQSDSDADQVTGRSALVTLGLGQNGIFDSTTLDLGYDVNARWINPTIDAGVYKAEPGIKITKWVCATGTGCEAPSATDLAKLAGYSAASGVIPGVPTDQWVKETIVNYGTGAEWLLVVTNTGKNNLIDVTVADTYTDGSGAPSCDDIDQPRDIAVGQPVFFRCTTESVTDTGDFKEGYVNDNSTPSPVFGEPDWATGDDLVNQAQATGTAVATNLNGTTATDAEGNPIIVTDANGNPLVLQSNISSAEVEARGYAIGDYLWIDSNKNGVQDAGENPLQGATASLLNGQGKPMIGEDGNPKTMTTGADGLYYFDNLAPGDYQVQFTYPSGHGYVWTVTGGGAYATDSDADRTSGLSPVVTLGPDVERMVATSSMPYGENLNALLINPTVDAGVYVPSPAIKLTKWVCSQYDNTNTPLCASPTGADLDILAGYVDGHVVAGQPDLGWVKQYTVPYGAQASWLIVATNTGDTVLTNVSLNDNLAGDRGSAALGRGATEPVSPTSYPTVDPGQSVTFTTTTLNVTNLNDKGSLARSDVDQASAEPTYQMGDDVVNRANASAVPVGPDNKPVTIPGVTSATGTIGSNTSAAEANTIGYAVGDYLWIDSNRNGVQDRTEQPLQGATVTLLDSYGNPATDFKGQVIPPFTTGADGYYYFDNLPAGTYQIQFAYPEGQDYVWTLQGRGTSATDSDADLETGLSALFRLGSGEANMVTVSSQSSLPYTKGLIATWINPTIDAGVYIPSQPVTYNPGLKLTKWVCSQYDADNQPTCAAPTGSDLSKMAGYVDGKVTRGLGANGWVKQVTAAYNAAASWLIVVTNTGDTPLTNVTLDDTLAGDPGSADLGRGATGNADPGSYPVVDPGQSVIFTTTTAGVTNVQAKGSLQMGDIDPASGEPTYQMGDDVVNSAAASGTPVDQDNQPIVIAGVTGPDGTMTSNTSEAEVNTVAPPITPATFAVGDYLWIDSNRNGVQDLTEHPLAGATVTLLDEDGNTVLDADGRPVAPVITGADGYYWFDNLPAGSYQIKFAYPDGQGYLWTLTGRGTVATDSDADIDTGLSPVFTLGADAVNMVATSDTSLAGYAKDLVAGMINPTIDAGVYIPSEPVTYNPGLKLTKWVCSQYGTTGQPECTAPTGSDLSQLAGYVNGQVVASESDGNWVKQYQVGYGLDALWMVIATNTGDTTLTNVTVNDSLVGVTADGQGVTGALTPASAAKLDPGQSQVFFATTTDVMNVNPWGPGATGEIDSAAEPVYATGDDVANQAQATATVVDEDGNPVVVPNVTDKNGTITSNTSNAEINTVEVVSQTYAVGDYLWIDANRNGVQDKGEAPLAGANVTLLDESGHTVGTYTTGADGYYWFDDLPAGTYQIQFTYPEDQGYVWTLTGHGTYATDSDADIDTGLSARFTLGSDEEHMMAVSSLSGLPYTADLKAKLINPTIDAGVYVPQAPVEYAPGLKLTKWVCSTYDQDNKPTCAVPEQGSDEFTSLAGYSDADSVFASAPADGWVKQFTVPYGAQASWLIVATNTGDTILTDVVVTDPVAGTPGSAALGRGATNAVDPASVAELDPGQSAVFTTTTVNVTNLNAKGDLLQGAADAASAEPTYRMGSDVVNTASAAAKPVGSDGEPVIGPDGKQITSVPSNPSSAEVNTVGFAVGDYVWIDSNWNGVQDENEPVAGARVELLDDQGRAVTGADGQPLVATTGTDGYYYFDNLPAGKYQVRFTLPDTMKAQGYIWTATGAGNATNDSNPDSTGVTPVFTLGNGAANMVPVTDSSVPSAYAGRLTAAQINPTIDAGAYLPNAGLKLTKWVCSTYTADNKPNCVAPEAGSDVLATLAGYTASGVVAGQPAGGWVKQYAVPYGSDASWLLVATNIGDVPLAGVSVRDLLVGAADTAAGRGATSAVSPESWASTLMPGESAVFTSTTSVITNMNAMGDLKPGQVYTGTGETAYGMGTDDVVNTATASGTPVDRSGNPIAVPGAGRDLTVTSNPSTAEAATSVYAVGDYVWVDANNNGKQDTGESALADVVVKLIRNGVTVAQTTTNADGYYWFDTLPAGTYQIEFTLPDGYSWTTQNASGVDAGANSDANPATGRTAEFTLGADATGMIAITDESLPSYAKDLTAKMINPTIDAGVFVPTPPPPGQPTSGLKLTKWVCGTGTDCTTPTGDDLAALAGYVDGHVVAGAPAGGWAKETTVEYNTGVDWLIVVTNYGETRLTDVSIDDSYVLQVGGSSATCGDISAVALDPGQIATQRCTTESVTNTHDFAAGNNNTIDPATGEPTWNYGDDLVNVAVAIGTPPPPAPGEKTPPPVPSNPSTAEVKTTPLVPGLKLTKWVCETGTGCADPTPAQLITLSGVSTGDSGVIVTAGQSVGGWVKETTVPYGTSAEWLLVASNIGQTDLANVTISSESVVDDPSKSGSASVDPGATPLIDPVTALAPGESVAFKATTASVRNLNAPDHAVSDTVDPVTGEPTYAVGDDVVNTAIAQGTPVDKKGNPVPLPNQPKGSTAVYPPQPSNPSNAEVNAVAYAVGDYVWIDANGNGVQDENEKPIAGATVALLHGDGTPVLDESGAPRTTTTDANGYYLFDLLPAGEYMVEFTLPNGYLWTTSLNGDVTADSDAVNDNSAAPTARSGVFTLGPGSANLVASSTMAGLYSTAIVAPFINPSLDAGVIEAMPSLDLEKYVCSTGTGCTNPSDTPLIPLTLLNPAGGWVKATTVDNGTSADWLIVIQNTGNVAMANVNLTQEDFNAGGAGFTNKNCGIPDNPVTLQPGQIDFIICTIDNVTNVEALGSGKDIVNTAKAEGTPVDKTGKPLITPKGENWGPVPTKPSTAEVNTTPLPPTPPTPKPETGGSSIVSSNNSLAGAGGALALAGIVILGIAVIRKRFS